MDESRILSDGDNLAEESFQTGKFNETTYNVLEASHGKKEIE